MNNDIQNQFRDLCKNIGWKCTPQRLAVYAYLQQNHTHPSVDVVWDAVRCSQPTISRESVYRILNELSEHGIIGRVDHIDNARYDCRIGAHGHFICKSCREISDFDWPDGTQIPPELLARQVQHIEIRLVGVCPKCAAAHKQKRHPSEKPASERADTKIGAACFYGDNPQEE